MINFDELFVYKEPPLQLTLDKTLIKSNLYTYIKKYKYLENFLKIHRRKNKAKAHQMKTSIVLQDKFLKIMPTDADLLKLKQDLKKIKDLNLENYIIQYWHQGNTQNKALQAEKPWKIYHQISLTTVEKYYKGKHVVLDWDSLLDLINFPIDIKEKLENFRRIAMLSDLVRTALLFCYGGTWLDFTMLLLDKIPQPYLDKDLAFFYRHGALDLDFLSIKNPKRSFIAYSPYYFSWDSSFEVNMLSSFIHAKEGHRFLGILLKVMFDFVRQENPRAHEYLSYQILVDLLMRREEFKYLRYDLTKSLPSDACAHLMQVFDYRKFDNHVYQEICARFPLQKLNWKCDLIKGSLFYESLLKQGLFSE